MKPDVLLAAAVALAGTGVLAVGTDGFRAYTSEAARRAAVLRAPRALPAVELEDQDGRRFRLGDFRGRLLAVEFIYTHCQTLCVALGGAFAQIRDRLGPQALGREVVLLSVSFDPARDDPARLRQHARHLGADGDAWRLARIADPAGLKAMLATFGIVVIPDGAGGFEHNAAIHLVGRDGRLRDIADYDKPASAVEKLRSLL